MAIESKLLTVADVVGALGGNATVAALLGVGESSVCNYKAENRFPPKHHLTVARLCEAAGIDYDPAPASERAA